MTDTRPIVDVKRLIDEERFSPYQWLILAVCFLTIAVDTYDAFAVGFVVPALMQEWHVGKDVLGPVMSASIFGMAIGALLAGPLFDRTTPKTVMVFSMLVFGICSLCSITATSPLSLGLWRLFTGIGIGAAVPGATTLVFEYAPARRSALTVNAMGCGGMLGAALCGVTAGVLVPGYGWKSLFVAGAVLPIVLALVVQFSLPEPMRFMVMRDWPAQRIAAVLRRIAPGRDFDGVRFVFSEEQATDRKSGMAAMLSRPLRTGTIMLWITYCVGTFSYYLLMGWMPTLVQESGASLREATLATSLLSLGGIVGAFGVGWLMDRFERNAAVAAAFVVGGVAVWMIGQQSAGTALLPAIIFIAGVGLNGAIFSMGGLAAAFYPTNGRSAGIAWMYGIGRIGGILGPIAGGFLLRANSGTGLFYLIVTGAVLMAAAALWIKRRASGGPAGVSAMAPVRSGSEAR
ncbi:MFS transporter [Cupriavidus necator]|uniref:4-hydroxybenzoate transporter n=1 Tax=Cupriavidus pinatubonensis (strain JMP 134 / LMG 1197) TaxID=264198 RepID=Q46SG7_CUPPJ|nr:MFS transporter [Cupriavidus necator]